MPPRTELTIEQRIRARIDSTAGPDACWPWTGTVNPKTGYGTFTYRDREQGGKVIGCLAHRAVYELLVGPIPDGLTIDHLCMVKTCVNPSHLEPVTHLENMRRARAALGPEPFRAATRNAKPLSDPLAEERRQRRNAYRRARYAASKCEAVA